MENKNITEEEENKLLALTNDMKSHNFDELKKANETIRNLTTKCESECELVFQRGNRKDKKTIQKAQLASHNFMRGDQLYSIKERMIKKLKDKNKYNSKNEIERANDLLKNL